MYNNIIIIHDTNVITLCQCNHVVTVSTMGGCGGLERNNFQQFPIWEDMVLLRLMILENFYSERV